MGLLTTSVLVAILFAAPMALPQQTDPGPSSDRIFGTVETAAGHVYRGYIRWDRNEGSWTDLLQGSKELPFRNLRQAEELTGRGWRNEDRRSIEILGFRISWADDDYPDAVASGVRFGHLRELVVLDDDRVRLTLKSGQELELEGGSTDVGDGNRGIEVVDPERGSVELRWRDLDRIRFEATPDEPAPGGMGHRLHGTLRTRDGLEFTGYVGWDVDEILSGDVLDGEERGRDREIPFGRIAAIERAGHSGAIVVLQNGEELELRGSNDVDHGNRGISISDPALGQVTAEWDEFESLTFHPARRPTGYDAFDGGRPLRGTVLTEDGARRTGRIRWDNDEEHSWEILNGEHRDVEFHVELSAVASIRKRSSDGVEVFLTDGRTFELEDSNDVDGGNKGIFVTGDDGETVVVEWDEFAEVRFYPE